MIRRVDRGRFGVIRTKTLGGRSHEVEIRTSAGKGICSVGGTKL